MFAGANRIQSSSSARLLVKSLAILSLAFLTQGLSAEDTPATVKSALTHSIGGFELTINNGSETCSLQTKDESSNTSQTLPLLLEAPCYWVTSDKTKKLVNYGYESIDVDNTLVVAGTLLDWPVEKMSYQKLPENTYCSQHLQGIIISKKEIFAVNEKMVGAHCESGLAVDEKIFYAMAHNPERYQEKVIDKATEVKIVEAPAETNNPAKAEDKSLFDSVAESIKSFFSGNTEDAK